MGHEYRAKAQPQERSSSRADSETTQGNVGEAPTTTPHSPGGRYDLPALSPATVLALQRSIGNAAVNTLLQKSPRDYLRAGGLASKPVGTSGNSVVIQRVKLKDTKWVAGLYSHYKIAGEFLMDNDKQQADAEIAALNKAGFIELINDLTTEQLQLLERWVPTVTQRINQILTPHAYGGVVPNAQTIQEVGTFNVVPDNVAVDPNDYGTLRQTDFAKLQGDWQKIKDSQSQFIVMEVNKDGVKVPTFRPKVLQCIGQVLSRPSGRQLIQGLAFGAVPILIMPASVSTMLTPETATHKMGQTVLGIPAGATPTDGNAYLQPYGVPGKGTGSRVELDPNLDDNTTISYDKDGKQIQNPIFVILAHELVHAKHNAQGTNASLLPGSPGYTNREEQNTIENEENSIRAEHLEKRLGQRVGHSGKDQREVQIPK